jgi:hypothetical protein
MFLELRRNDSDSIDLFQKRRLGNLCLIATVPFPIPSFDDLESPKSSLSDLLARTYASVRFLGDRHANHADAPAKDIFGTTSFIIQIFGDSMLMFSKYM